MRPRVLQETSSPSLATTYLGGLQSSKTLYVFFCIIMAGTDRIVSGTYVLWSTVIDISNLRSYVM